MLRWNVLIVIDMSENITIDLLKIGDLVYEEFQCAEEIFEFLWLVLEIDLSLKIVKALNVREGIIINITIGEFLYQYDNMTPLQVIARL